MSLDRHHRDGQPLLEVVGGYEHDVLEHGFALLEDSLGRTREMFGWPISVPASAPR